MHSVEAAGAQCGVHTEMGVRVSGYRRRAAAQEEALHYQYQNDIYRVWVCMQPAFHQGPLAAACIAGVPNPSMQHARSCEDAWLCACGLVPGALASGWGYYVQERWACRGDGISTTPALMAVHHSTVAGTACRCYVVTEYAINHLIVIF